MGSVGVGDVFRFCRGELSFAMDLNGDRERGGAGDLARGGGGDLARLTVGGARFDQEPSPC